MSKEEYWIVEQAYRTLHHNTRNEDQRCIERHECCMLNEEMWKQNMDIDWECKEQGCWIALEAYGILHRIH